MVPNLFCRRAILQNMGTPRGPHVTNNREMTKIINAIELVPRRTDGQLLLSGFQSLETLTLTLDRVIWHTVMHQSWSSIHLSNFTENGKTFFNFFVDGLSAGTCQSSRSRDTKTRINIKNPAPPNVDSVL